MRDELLNRAVAEAETEAGRTLTDAEIERLDEWLQDLDAAHHAYETWLAGHGEVGAGVWDGELTFVIHDTSPMPPTTSDAPF